MTLKSDITSDLDTFLDTDEFAVSITYNSTTIKGIFDDEYKGVNALTGEIEATAPQAIVKTSDVSGIAHGNTLTINSTTYYVIGIQQDGTGLTILILSKDSP